MRATSIGHAGILVETDAGSIVCDPWFVPAFFGSWFVFPRNDQLSDDLMNRIENADYLYITHLHADHHDEPFLREHFRRDIPILLPGYPTREQQRTLARLGFTNFVRTLPITYITLHGLRHTHATQLLAAGVNPRVVSERLGHANVAFTLQVYGHVLPGQQRQAAEAAAGLLG